MSDIKVILYEDSYEEKKLKYQAIESKYPEWLREAEFFFTHEHKMRRLEYCRLTKEAGELADTYKQKLPDESKWDWDLDLEIHSPDGESPSKADTVRFLHAAGTFPYWPHENFKKLHDYLSEYDKVGAYYIIPGHNESPGYRMYRICRDLIGMMADAQPHYHQAPNFDPTELSAPFRFDWSEYHHSGVYVFRNFLRRVARPCFWNSLPGAIKVEFIGLCSEMLVHVQQKKPYRYGLITSPSAWTRDWATIAGRVLCTIV